MRTQALLFVLVKALFLFIDAPDCRSHTNMRARQRQQVCGALYRRMHAFEALYHLSFLKSKGADCKEKRKKKRGGNEESK
jgi:hypothetical protein